MFRYFYAILKCYTVFFVQFIQVHPSREKNIIPLIDVLTFILQAVTANIDVSYFIIGAITPYRVLYNCTYYIFSNWTG